MKKNISVEQIEEITKGQKFTALYLYTPLCGTCMVTGKMVDVTEKLFPQISFIKADLNYIPEAADKYSVESVPCMLLFRRGSLVNKIYAFQSVPYLHEQLNYLTSADSI
ncbi:thioredoxin family protein [Rossellomorea vietnamensis]|uniref:Thioredoxin family protein n=1 Tax=Rossellomorea vietnamensis TaxID=218284 RepID=A0A5D4MAP0_9BACI|nr:thioredoxin family protein [Rossellomorea vietnamensis]TYR99019.1 thioredoxin family protein [Rossellomorea vietnamensis]